MPKRKFTVSFVVSVEVEVEQGVIDDALSEEWKESFYDLQTPERVAEHLAYNYLRNQVDDISRLDGFAHCKKEHAEFSDESWDDPEVSER